jgi:hypothetical protein
LFGGGSFSYVHPVTSRLSLGDHGTELFWPGIGMVVETGGGAAADNKLCISAR